MNKTNYTVHPETNTIVAVREFDAPVDQVWHAWTDSNILDQWWAPKPWKAITKNMTCEPGGMWLYAMTGPNGEKHYSRLDFKEIVAQQYFIGDSCFCDEHGKPDAEMAGTIWKVEFTTINELTRVKATLEFHNSAIMEKLLAMGFQGGFAMAHENLDDYFRR